MGCANARRRGVNQGDVLALLFTSLLAWALPCVAQQLPTQDVYFHRGAQHFLAGSNQLAKAEVERGLQLHPDDPHLKQFWELLNQQQQDQQNSDDQKNEDKKDQKDQKDPSKQDQKDQQKKDEKDSSKQDQQKKDQQKQDQQKGQKPDDKEQQQAGKKDEEKKEGEDAKAGQSKPEEGPEGDPEGQAQQAKMIRMTPQQAIQLMETLKGDEKTFQFKPVLRTNRTEQLRKNW